MPLSRLKQKKMKNNDKTREQLLKDLEKSNVKIAELEKSETERKKQKQAFQKSEQELKAIFNGARDGIALLDKTGKILRINKYIVEIGGFTEEEIVGKRFNALKMFPLKSITKMITVFGKLIKGQEIIYEVEVYTKKGEKKIVQIINSLLKKEEKVEGIISILTDITERKQADKMLQESEQRFRKLLENVPAVAVQGYNADGDIHYWNKANESIYDYTAEEAIGKNLIDLIIPPEMKEDVKKIIKHGAKTGEMPPAAEVTLMRKDGKPVTVLSSHAVVQQPGKEPELFCIDVDLTEHRRAEAEIRKLSKVVETTPEAVVITDMQETIEYVNQGLLTLGGFEDDNLIIGKSIFMFSNEEGVKQLQEEIIPTILSDGKWRGEVPVKRKDGSIFPVDMVCSLILDEEGKPKYLLSQYHDITIRKKAEEELQEKMNELEAFYRATLGREDRVIELKQEVNELLEQLGKDKKYRDNSG